MLKLKSSKVELSSKRLSSSSSTLIETNLSCWSLKSLSQSMCLLTRGASTVDVDCHCLALSGVLRCLQPYCLTAGKVSRSSSFKRGNVIQQACGSCFGYPHHCY